MSERERERESVGECVCVRVCVCVCARVCVYHVAMHKVPNSIMCPIHALSLSFFESYYVWSDLLLPLSIRTCSDASIQIGSALVRMAVDQIGHEIRMIME